LVTAESILFSIYEGKASRSTSSCRSAEKLAHLQHEDWLAHCPKATPALIAKALEILDRPTRHAPEETDKLPKGNVRNPVTEDWPY
jgi:hypothetical protein